MALISGERYDGAVAADPKPLPVDPVDDDIASALRDPEVRQVIDEYEAEAAAGTELADVIPHEEVRRRLEQRARPDHPSR
jgi:hypothetical protein